MCDLSRVGTHSIRQVISPSPLVKIGLTPLPTTPSDGRFKIHVEIELKKNTKPHIGGTRYVIKLRNNSKSFSMYYY